MTLSFHFLYFFIILNIRLLLNTSLKMRQTIKTIRYISINKFMCFIYKSKKISIELIAFERKFMTHIVYLLLFFVIVVVSVAIIITEIWVLSTSLTEHRTKNFRVPKGMPDSVLLNL